MYAQLRKLYGGLTADRLQRFNGLTVAYRLTRDNLTWHVGQVGNVPTDAYLYVILSDLDPRV